MRTELSRQEFGQRAFIRLLIERVIKAGYKICLVTTWDKDYRTNPGPDLIARLLRSGQHADVYVHFLPDKIQPGRKKIVAHWIKLTNQDECVNDWSISWPAKMQRTIRSTKLT